MTSVLLDQQGAAWWRVCRMVRRFGMARTKTWALTEKYFAVIRVICNFAGIT